jgi:predicted RNA-binding protein with TRAM domain
MWKKLVLSAGLLACLGLPAFATEPNDVKAVTKKSIPLEVKGKLRRELPCNPGVLWELDANGVTYDLDFGNKHDLWMLAEKSVGQTVLVKGAWDGDRLHVASLTADVEHVHKAIKVEVKGRLSFCPPVHLLAEPRLQKALDPCLLGGDWQICVGDKFYTLIFADSQLAQRANELQSRTVLLTGDQDGDVIRVATMKAEVEYLKVTQTDVELKGKLQYVITKCFSDEVVKVCDELPENFSRSWSVNFGVVVDGQTYILDLSQVGSYGVQVERFVGATVQIDGTLDGNKVKVKTLKPADRDFEKIPA